MLGSTKQGTNLTTVTKAGQIIAEIDMCAAAPASVRASCTNLSVEAGNVYQISRSSILVAWSLVVAEINPLDGSWLRFGFRPDDLSMSINDMAHIAYDEVHDRFAWMNRRKGFWGMNITMWSFSSCSPLPLSQTAPDNELLGIRYLAYIECYVVADPILRSLYFYSVTNNSLEFLTHVSLAAKISDIIAFEIDSYGTIVLTSSFGLCLYYPQWDTLNCVDSSPMASARMAIKSSITFEMDGQNADYINVTILF